ncbi:hypothetical protein LSCM1_04528 [Leishmania martiniquensis]|uniref:Uncharacterized protein n=1 Tax=Leishmania martiniquensis TaxID=1580590 RepID=A0A836HBY0_9TRYP|nr:hypothetical protein LSCM1_04528 [Leishmania martiniquensis]
MAGSASFQAKDRAAGADITLPSCSPFQERVNALLSVSVPRCLQDTSHGNSPSQAVHMSVGEGTGLGVAAKLSDHDEQSTQRDTATSDMRALPIYEALLLKGRQMQERRELLRQQAIEDEMRELRPVTLYGLAPRSARRLLTEGQRIEVRLLQRAKEKQALEEKAAQMRAEREAEELASIASFHPQISAHAMATKSRFKEPPPDRGAWRERRSAELAHLSVNAGAEVLDRVQDAPSINARSAKLAARKKAREGLNGLPVSEVLLVGEHRRRLAQWQVSEAEREAQARASPAITRHAASLQRIGSVGDRLHAGSYKAAIRHLQREVAWNESHTPFRPLVTALAAATAPRYHRESDPGAHSRILQGSRSFLHQHSAKQHSFEPSINPVSSAIARRLPETTMERLCRPSAVHSLSSYTDPASFTDASGVSPSAPPDACSQTPRGLRRAPSGRQQHSAVSNAPPSTPGALPSSVLASLDAYERRRQRRLEALRKELAEHEQRECTFQPQINVRSVPLMASSTSTSCQRGPSAVAKRSGEWQQQRERHLETMQRWYAEQAAADAESIEAPFRGGARAAATASLPLSHSIYGGDGTPWGVEEYLSRQQLARTRRQKEQETLGRQSLSFDGCIHASLSSATPPARAHVASVRHERDDSTHGRTSSPIRSLRLPVPESQQ